MTVIEPEGVPDQRACHNIIGSVGTVRLEVTVADAVTVEADLAIAGMFIDEPYGAPPGGGLRHLDGVLDGALLRLRKEGILDASVGATMLLDRPPAPVRAGAVLIVGMGVWSDWRADTMRRVMSAAVSAAQRYGAASAAFAPGLIDSRIPADWLRGASEVMVDAVAHALRKEEMGTLTRWLFCSSGKCFEQYAAALVKAFEARR